MNRLSSAPQGPDRLARGVSPWNQWLAGLVITVCLALAASNAFVQDDAFISFRYARNLVETGELTWNSGEAVPVEGYTNFLWTMLLAGGLTLGAEPVITSQVLGLAAFLGTLLVTWRLAAGMLQSQGRALVAVGLLGTNYTFSCFATGGLETQLQAFLISASAAVAWRIARPADADPGTRRFAVLSALTAAAILTRLDSALPCSILFAWVWLAWLRRRPPPRAIVGRVIASASPALLLLGPWLGWKLAYYGEILPNTYHSKVLAVSLGTMGQGLLYGLNFLTSYLLLPILVLALARSWRLLRRQELSVFALVVLGWAAYLVRIGGDFMEFRMIVPVLPLVFVVAAFLIFTLESLRGRAFLVALVLFGSGFHAWNFRDAGDLETISSLRAHLESESANWPGAGRALGELFAGAEPPVIIATTAAGAIPYYSRLPTVDMLGLNDLWLARHGSPKGTRPGHAKQAGVEYLLRRRVQLVLAHPWVERLSDPADGEATFPVYRLHDLLEVDPDLVPAGAKILEIPIDGRFGIKVLYLVPHPGVDEVIEERGLRAWPLDRGIEEVPRRGFEPRTP